MKMSVERRPCPRSIVDRRGMRLVGLRLGHLASPFVSARTTRFDNWPMMHIYGGTRNKGLNGRGSG